MPMRLRSDCTDSTKFSSVLRCRRSRESRRACRAAGEIERAGEHAALPEKLREPGSALRCRRIAAMRRGRLERIMRIGTGYDVHRLVEGRTLILCGVTVPYEKGLLGHSDADVATHALMDAMLGAAGLGDIGLLFPDDDPQYEGASSMKLLQEVREKLLAKLLVVENLDITIIAQAPKLRPYIDAMRERLADALELELDQVNVKATTEEGLGFTGNGQGIAAQAVCLLASALEDFEKVTPGSMGDGASCQGCCGGGCASCG